MVLNSNKRPSNEVTDYLIGRISSKFDNWDDVRLPSLKTIETLENAIYPNKGTSTSKIKMPEIYEIKETYKSHIWQSWFSSLDGMFDVKGRGRQDEQFAQQQKAALIDTFRKINFVEKLEKGLDNWINKGEFIAFISWKTITRKRRQKNINYENIINPETQEIEPVINSSFSIIDDVIYDGADLTIIDPENFVFDPHKMDDFDTCPKIYKSWATYEDIVENKLYEGFLNSRIKDDLKKLGTPGDVDNYIAENKLQDQREKIIKGDQIELLEYWGDIRLEDGTLKRNQVVTIAGRSHLIRMEDNPFIINPFVFTAFMEDTSTKRGISPLYVALPLNEISTTILNLQLEALKLIINKPYLAPKGSITGKINIKEGSIIEYDPALMPREPIPLDFKDALIGWDFLKFFENKIESATGIFKYMSGSPSDTKERTATQFQGERAASNTRIAKEIDFLDIKVKIPIIERIAELQANFNFDIQEVRVNKENNQMDFVLIDETIRQGNYEYIIGSSSDTLDRKEELKESLDLLFQFTKSPVSSQINWVEVFKWAFEQLGASEPQKFINEAPPPQMLPDNNMLQSMPPEMGGIQLPEGI
jgi:hypothetical protein